MQGEKARNRYVLEGKSIGLADGFEDGSEGKRTKNNYSRFMTCTVVVLALR